MLGAGRQALNLARSFVAPPLPQLLAVGHSTTPFLTVYENDSGTLTKLDNPADLPGNIVYGVDWNPTGDILAVISITPEVSFYQLSDLTLTRLAQTFSVPGTAQGVAWNPAGTSVAVAHTNTPFITVYNWDGTTFTALSSGNFDSLPGASQRSVSWSSDGSQLYTTGNQSGGSTSMLIWDRSGDTFTRNSATLGSMSVGYTVARSPASAHLVEAGTPVEGDRAVIYETDGATYEIITSAIDTQPVNLPRGADWNSDSSTLAIAHYTSPFVSIYNRSGDAFTKIANPATLPPGNAFGCAWSRDDQYLAVVGQTTPFLRVYSRSGDTFTAFGNPVTLPTGQGWGCAWNK